MLRTIIGVGLLLTGILLSASQGGAQFERDSEATPKSFMSGKDWKALSKGEQQAYAVGVVDGLDLAYAYSKMKPTLAGLIPVLPAYHRSRSAQCSLRKLTPIQRSGIGSSSTRRCSAR